MNQVTLQPSAPMTFKAVWTKENKHLDESFINKITRYAFFILNRIATISILPASLTLKKEIDRINRNFEENWTRPIGPGEVILKNNFTPTPLKITTPDGVDIHGTFFKNKRGTNSSPTVIFFQPNAVQSKQGIFDWVMREAAFRNLPYNFVSFDPRGCSGTYPNPRSAKDLYLDADSVYQFVKEGLGVSGNNTHLMGMSLGGAISGKLKELHPEISGNYVNDRSFRMLSDVITNVLPQNLFYRFIAQIGRLFTNIVNWNMDVSKAFENPAGKTLIVHHPDDELMKKDASLYRHIFQQNGKEPSPQISHLDLSRSTRRPGFIHGSPLEYFDTNAFNPSEEIAKFLFNTSVSQNQKIREFFQNAPQKFREMVYEIVAKKFQNGGYYFGSGEDACLNRNNQSVTESQLASAIMEAKYQAY